MNSGFAIRPLGPLGYAAEWSEANRRPRWAGMEKSQTGRQNLLANYGPCTTYLFRVRDRSFYRILATMQKRNLHASDVFFYGGWHALTRRIRG